MNVQYSYFGCMYADIGHITISNHIDRECNYYPGKQTIENDHFICFPGSGCAPADKIASRANYRDRISTNYERLLF
jgi:hypothetical protein